jgi:putative endonuclease
MPLRQASVRRSQDWLRDRKRSQVWSAPLAAGRRGEDLAHRYLQGQGYIVVARNYRLASGDGEADIVAWDGDVLAIVEVKSRASDEYGPPERAIGPEKRAHMRRVAREFAARAGTPWEQVRYDVVAVLLTQPPHISLYRGV